MKITPIIGNKYYKEGDDYQIIIIPSGTIGYHYVIIDSAFQDNEYYHLTKQQIKEKYNIILAL